MRAANAMAKLYIITGLHEPWWLKNVKTCYLLAESSGKAVKFAQACLIYRCLTVDKFVKFCLEQMETYF